MLRPILLACALTVGCAPAQSQPVSPLHSQANSDQPTYPAPIPASCSVTAMRSDKRQGFPAYWIDGANLAAGVPLGILREGENKIQWQGESGELVVGGRSLDGAGTVQLINPVRLGVAIYSTSVAFSHPGCWQLTATLGPGSLDAIVYAFPR